MKKFTKVLIIGSPASGKTNLMNYYVGNDFIANHKETTDADLMTKTLPSDLTAQIWDMPDTAMWLAFAAKPNYMIYCIDAAKLNNENFDLQPHQARKEKFAELIEGATNLLFITKTDLTAVQGNETIQLNAGKLAKLLGIETINAVSVANKQVHALESFITERQEIEEDNIPEQDDAGNVVPQNSVAALTKFLSEQRSIFMNKDGRLSFTIVELEGKIGDAKKDPAKFEELLKETRATFKNKGRFGFFSHNPLDQYFDATFKLKDVPQSAWKLGCGGW